MQPSSSCARGIDPERIGGIGQTVGGEMMLESAARSDGLRAVVSEGAGIRSAREAGERADAGLIQNLGVALQTPGVALFSNDPWHPTWLSSLARLRPGRSS